VLKLTFALSVVVVPSVDAPKLVAEGTVRTATGVTAADAADTVDVVPPPLGVTVKVYDVPLVSPEIVQLCEVVGAVELKTVQVKPPGFDVTT
jgi:hypothetical protein